MLSVYCPSHALMQPPGCIDGVLTTRQQRAILQCHSHFVPTTKEMWLAPLLLLLRLWTSSSSLLSSLITCRCSRPILRIVHFQPDASLKFHNLHFQLCLLHSLTSVQVLLFTVNDADCRIVRRPQGTDESFCSVVNPTGTGVTTALAKGGVTGSIPRIDSKTNNTGRSSTSHQRGHSVPGGANFVRSAAPPSSGTGRSKGGKASGKLARSGCPSDGKDFFVGNSDSGRANSEGIAGTKGRGQGDTLASAGAQGNISFDRNWEEGGLDSGPTLCSSVSTLSGDAF